MKRYARATMILPLLAPLLLGAATSRVPAVSNSTSPSQPATTTKSSNDHSRTPTVSSPMSGYSITWSSLNGGGTTAAASPNYSMGSSLGQSVAGKASSPNFAAGIGFWYGAGNGCNCPNQGDINGDAVIDVFDVIGVISIAFSGAPDPQDPLCPKTRGDVNNDGATDVFDVIYLIATAFSGGPNPVNPCGP